MVHYPIRLKAHHFVKLTANKQKNAFHPLTSPCTALICAPFTRFLCSSVGRTADFNPYVTGSSPVRGAKFKKACFKQAFCFLITNALKTSVLNQTNLHRHSRSTLQRSICAIYTTSCPLINARKDGVTGNGTFGQTHILHDCATAAHELPATLTIRFRCVFHWLINNLNTSTSGTLSNRYLISSLRRRIQP